jgi:hypothetical protein
MSGLWADDDVLTHLYPYIGILLVPDFRLLYGPACLLDLPGPPEGRGAHQP